MALVFWHGVDWEIIAAFTLLWELVYQVNKRIMRRYASQNDKVAKLGASYLTAFENAVVCSVAGCYITWSLYDADETARAVLLGELWSTEATFFAARSFLGWLFMDLVHLVTHWPKLGTWDTLLHHAGFACLTLLGYGYRVLPFTVGWLLLGEISTLFLNARWFLINTGRGESFAMKATNYSFALTFFTFRIVVLWLGLEDLLVNLRPLLLARPYHAPAWSINIICFFVTGSALLNAFWMQKILKMAGKGASDKAAAGSPPRTPNAGPELPLFAPSPASVSRRVGSAEALSDVYPPFNPHSALPAV